MLVGVVAGAVAAAWVAVEDTWVAPGTRGGWYLYGLDLYERLPELEGISGSVIIGCYSERGSYLYRGSYRPPYCCGHSSQLVCRTCRARKTAKTWEGKSRIESPSSNRRQESSNRIERVDRV